MSVRMWLAILVIATAWASTEARSFADDKEAPKGKEAEPKAKEEKVDPFADMRRRMIAMQKGMATFVGDTRLSEASVQSLLKHAPSFHAIGEGEQEEDDEVDRLLEETYKKKGVYDFSLIVGVKELQTWAAGRGVKAATWFKSLMRAQCLFMREEMLKNAKLAKKQAVVQMAELEKSRKQMGEEFYMASRKAIEAGVKMAEAMAKGTAVIPAATDVETKLLTKHGAKLRSAVEGPDDVEDEMGDEMGDG